MGMPPIAIGLMSFAVPLESAIAIMVVPTMVTNIWQAIYGGGFRLLMRRFGVMAIAAMIGILAVGLFLSDLGSPRTAGWVGVLLVLYSLHRADAVAAARAAPRRAVGQSADRPGERRGGRQHRRRRGALPALHAVARDGPARVGAGAGHHVPVHHRHAGGVARPARRLSPHQQRGGRRRRGADHGRRVARPARPPAAVAARRSAASSSSACSPWACISPARCCRTAPCPCPTTSSSSAAFPS